ncbi:MAG: adenylate/guanylate cyclase domain-containing protein [Archangium sp.]
MRALLARLVNLGTTEGLDPRELKHVRLLNQICLVAVVMSLFAFGDPRMRTPILLTTSISAVLLYTFALVLSARQQHFIARCLVGLGSLVWITLDGIFMGADTQQHLFIAAAATGGWLIIPRREVWLAWVGAVVGLICLAGVELYNHSRLGVLDHFPYDTLDKVTMFVILQALAFYAASQTERAEDELATERAKSDGLLLNVLPRKIAERLKKDERSIAERFDEATVLFADIVNFTQLSERTGPTKLVQLLDQIFTRFDALADQHGLEKIKTIGDAYMVVGGLPEPKPDHAHRVARMALDMQGVLATLDRETFEGLAIRIGIHTGPVVAGVIGTRKFAYDLWGDSVNTASRMESHGQPGRIQVTEAVYVKLKDHFEFEPRGAIAVKGKGELTTWFLTAPRATT